MPTSNPVNARGNRILWTTWFTSAEAPRSTNADGIPTRGKEMVPMLRLNPTATMPAKKAMQSAAVRRVVVCLTVPGK